MREVRRVRRENRNEEEEEEEEDNDIILSSLFIVTFEVTKDSFTFSIFICVIHSKRNIIQTRKIKIPFLINIAVNFNIDRITKVDHY